ncbi:MAG: CHAD domain-containing protein [Solirubrobacteraceae bacterium]
MSDFLAPETLTLKEAGETLSTELELRVGPVREEQRTFYDTFDGLLHARGFSVVREGSDLALICSDSGEERARQPSKDANDTMVALDLEPGRFREALTAIVDVRALLPVARVQSRVRALDVLDDERKTVVRMMLEVPELLCPSGSKLPLRPRLRLAPVRGYDAELDELHTRLRSSGFLPADQPLVDEAVTASGGAPGGTSSKIDVPLHYQQRSDAAAAAILRRLLEVMDANLDGAIADIDSEFLHDFRVAVRRSRAVQRELRGAFPPADLARFRTGFRWLQQATGDVRDLDVYVLEFDHYREMVPEVMRADLDPLLKVLRDRRRVARRKMIRALRSDRATRLRLQWASFLEQLVELPESDRPEAARPIGELAGERIGKVYRQMVKMGRQIDEASPPERFHELRKKGKELRYLLELFGGPLYPSEVVKPMIGALKALQDVLGRHQDREVQVATVRSLGNDVAILSGGATTLMAMGVLVERLFDDEQAARGLFAERFAAFASKDQRILVKDTFA